MKGMLLDVTDEVSGYCPACSSSRIKLVITSLQGNSSYLVQKGILCCEHQPVCELRHEYMEEMDEDE